MRAIEMALDELMGVLAAGFVGFFVMLACIVGSLIWFACGVVCFCFLLVALFSMDMWVFSHNTHAFDLMLGYFAYAGAAYAWIAAVSLSGQADRFSQKQTRTCCTRKHRLGSAGRRRRL